MILEDPRLRRALTMLRDREKVIDTLEVYYICDMCGVLSLAKQEKIHELEALARIGKGTCILHGLRRCFDCRNTSHYRTDPREFAGLVMMGPISEEDLEDVRYYIETLNRLDDVQEGVPDAPDGDDSDAPYAGPGPGPQWERRLRDRGSPR